MSEGKSFCELIRAVRAGHAGAAAELVRQFEPAIWREVERRRTQAALCRQLDVQDLSQIVLAQFFPCLTAGGYELHHPAQLHGLLRVMARNHLCKEVDKLRTLRRGRGAPHWAGPVEHACVDPGPSPSEAAAVNELRRQARLLLSEQEWDLVLQRAHGRTWTEIAAALGAQADALRMQLTRACERVAGRLGLEG
jgi:DNA-directed RNA polymerase specialized sigma24 family protein